jgi:hypothetical protein
MRYVNNGSKSILLHLIKHGCSGVIPWCWIPCEFVGTVRSCPRSCLICARRGAKLAEAEDKECIIYARIGKYLHSVRPWCMIILIIYNAQIQRCSMMPERVFQSQYSGASMYIKMSAKGVELMVIAGYRAINVIVKFVFPLPKVVAGMHLVLLLFHGSDGYPLGILATAASELIVAERERRKTRRVLC